MPMRRELYPVNWDAIAFEIKQQVNWRCEQCQRPCKRYGETLVDFEKRLLGGAKLGVSVATAQKTTLRLK
jgi:hypothetical protein